MRKNCGPYGPRRKPSAPERSAAVLSTWARAAPQKPAAPPPTMAEKGVTLIQVGGPALAGVVEEHGLLLGEEVHAFLRHLALADARALHAPERDLRLAADRRAVEVHHARLDLLGEAHRQREVLRVERARQAEGRVVRELHGLLEAARAR